MLFRNLSFLFIFLVGLFSFTAKGQSHDTPKISEQIMALSYIQTDKFNNGKKMLALATNDYERAKSYGHMGDALRKQNQIMPAISYFEKALEYARKSNFKTEEFTLNWLLTDAYNSIGLKNKADATFNRAKIIAEESKNKELLESLNALQVSFYLDRREFCKAVPFQMNLYHSYIDYLDKNKNANKTEILEINKSIGVSTSFLSFLYAKCGNLSSAQKYHQYAKKIEQENEKVGIENPYHEVFLLGSASILVKQNKTDSAKLNFEKAYIIANDKKSARMIELILEERLLSEVDNNDKSKQTSLLNELLRLKQSRLKHASEAVYTISKNDEKEIFSSSKNSKTITVISVVTIIFLAGLLFFYWKKSQRIKKRFKIIIEEIEKRKLEESILQTDHHFSDELKVESNIAKNPETTEQAKEPKPIISPQKEKELLTKLAQFEKGTKFTAKGFTQSKLASYLNTNTIYTNYILKEHRKQTFSEYLNGIRIKFLIDKLYDNPEYLNYKIGYLSEICGFSSHSKFTQTFKKEMKMAPSEFIDLLKEENRNRIDN